MKQIPFFFIAVFILGTLSARDNRNRHYITNQAPLVPQKYTALPIGTIRPEGMLLKMLEIQRDGLTGNMDSVYSLVCGPNNGWLGGTGDGWERGPYWLDGLVPLAYILDDDALKAKAREWIEWSLNNPLENGDFGPQPLPEGYARIEGTQQEPREDWWPKMVMLKVLQQYYSATGDDRVIKLLTNYFRYMLKELPERPLGHYTYWGNRRGADNLAVVYWLYNITKEKFLLELGELIHEQTFEWEEVFTGNRIRRLNPLPGLHCVNVAQGLKAPVIYYQQNRDKKYLESTKEGLLALKEVHGFVNGMYGGDEALHGNNPTQGSELCSATEMMFSFESMLPITGDVYYADYLEKIAYNVLPTQHTDDFTGKQYFQQANQVLITDQSRNFFNDHNARLVYGTTTGYPCCLTNMHQGWPKFVQNLWYATGDNGLAALVYGASKVKAKVAGGVEVEFEEETNYPFSDEIAFTYKTGKSVGFPLHLRVPLWCEAPELTINGEKVDVQIRNNIIVLDRTWNTNDKVVLTLPMEIRLSTWYEGSKGIERGPLVYGLKIEEHWVKVEKDRGFIGRAAYEDPFWEVYPKSDWNYALSRKVSPKHFEVEVNDKVEDMPWNLNHAPITLRVKAKKLDSWVIENNSAGDIKVPTRPTRYPYDKEEKIELIPYGCTTLRISQFPVW
ncbi:MAG: glycoside hydrolase family 127 protein [Cytophagales bacterium]|nr:glycoside hydrolase family 127 protein [Cytophagales bacterium]